jgi:hypothetical protein
VIFLSGFSERDSSWLNLVFDLDLAVEAGTRGLEPGVVHESALHATAEAIGRHESRHQVPARGDVQRVCRAEKDDGCGIR